MVTEVGDRFNGFGRYEGGFQDYFIFASYKQVNSVYVIGSINMILRKPLIIQSIVIRPLEVYGHILVSTMMS